MSGRLSSFLKKDAGSLGTRKDAGGRAVGVEGGEFGGGLKEVVEEVVVVVAVQCDGLDLRKRGEEFRG